jgi:SAM-dependent methyltransferase
MVFCDDLLRFLDVRAAQAVLREAARVLRPGALLLAWDLAPASGKFGWWQRLWLRAYRGGRISSEKSLMALAERSGFAYTREARLRPFLWPPIPRASFIAGTLPPGWRREGDNLVPPDEPAENQEPGP